MCLDVVQYMMIDLRGEWILGAPDRDVVGWTEMRVRELTFAISIHLPKPSCHEKTSILGYPGQHMDEVTRIIPCVSSSHWPGARHQVPNTELSQTPRDGYAFCTWEWNVNGTDLGVWVESWLEL